MGSPIRKSSDHSSFANSPRHIAGYNVLLRLLVPRHPPCALKNFNKNNTTETQGTPTKKLMPLSILGCSRPLYDSQTTNNPTQHRHTRPNQNSRRYMPPDDLSETPTPKPGVPVVSGPNSVFTNPPKPVPPAFQPPNTGWRTEQADRLQSVLLVNVSHQSTTTNTLGRRVADQPKKTLEAGLCSLERR